MYVLTLQDFAGKIYFIGGSVPRRQTFKAIRSYNIYFKTKFNIFTSVGCVLCIKNIFLTT